MEIIRGQIEYLNGKPWRVERYEYKTCHECNYPLVAMDPLRGERVCECGMTNKIKIMIADMDLKKQHSGEPLNNPKSGYTYDERKYLKKVRRAKHKTRTRVEETKKGNHGVYLKNNTKTSDWKKKQYILALGIISSQLLMTKTQKKKVEEIIVTHSLSMIHSRVNHKTTIAGICRYVLMKDSFSAGELRFNRSVFEFVGLSKPTYNIIEHNLKRLGL